MAAARANLILLVDDDADFRDALTIALEAAGYTVVAAADGQEALDRLRAGVEPNLIVLDLTMPRKGGERFRADQVADPKVATVPVILMSGEERLPEKARGLGVDMWVQKPFAANELLGLIARSSAP